MYFITDVTANVCVPLGFTGLSSAPSFWTSKHLRPLMWQEADLCTAQICPFPECNVQLIRESLEQTLLARPQPPDHYIAFTERRRRARTRCSISPGRQGEPRANQLERWQRTYRAYSQSAVCGSPQGLGSNYNLYRGLILCCLFFFTVNEKS